VFARRELIAASSDHPPERGFNILTSDLGLREGTGHEFDARSGEPSSDFGIALSGYGVKDDSFARLNCFAIAVGALFSVNDPV
jgi:hypothetical protein